MPMHSQNWRFLIDTPEHNGLVRRAAREGFGILRGDNLLDPVAMAHKCSLAEP